MAMGLNIEVVSRGMADVKYTLHMLVIKRQHRRLT